MICVKLRMSTKILWYIIQITFVLNVKWVILVKFFHTFGNFILWCKTGESFTKMMSIGMFDLLTNAILIYCKNVLLMKHNQIIKTSINIKFILFTSYRDSQNFSELKRRVRCRCACIYIFDTKFVLLFKIYTITELTVKKKNSLKK